MPCFLFADYMRFMEEVKLFVSKYSPALPWKNGLVCRNDSHCLSGPNLEYFT